MVGAGSGEGRQVLANLQAGGFRGDVAALAKPDDVAGLATAPDLAILAVQPTAELLQALAAKGTFAAVVICDAEGLPEAAGGTGVRVLGPGSFGICVPALGLNASRAHIVPPPVASGWYPSRLRSVAQCWTGPVRMELASATSSGWGGGPTLVSVSCLIGCRATPGPGQSCLISATSETVANFSPRHVRPQGCDPLSRSGRAECSQIPPAQRSVPSRPRCGAPGSCTVRSLEDLLAAAEVLARARPVRSESISIVTNARSPGRLAADATLRDGLQVAADVVVVEPDKSHRLANLAEAAAAAPGVGGVVVVHAPTGEGDSATMAALTAIRAAMKVPLLVCAMGETVGVANRRQLAQSGMAVFAHLNRPCVASCIWCLIGATVRPHANCLTAQCWP